MLFCRCFYKNFGGCNKCYIKIHDTFKLQKKDKNKQEQNKINCNLRKSNKNKNNSENQKKINGYNIIIEGSMPYKILNSNTYIFGDIVFIYINISKHKKS